MIYVTIVTMINKTMINMTMINMTMTNMTMIKHDHAQRDYDISDDAEPRRPCRHLLPCTWRWSPLTAGDSGHSKNNLTPVLRTAQSKSTLPPKPKKTMIRKGGNIYQIIRSEPINVTITVLPHCHAEWDGLPRRWFFSFCIFCLIALQVMSSSSTFLIPIHIIQPHSYQNIHDQPYGMIFSFW